jgi:DNA recombination protein RmuC
VDVTVLIVGALLLGIGLAVGAFAGSRMASRRASAAPELAAALAPATDTLYRVEAALHGVERDRIDAWATLREQIGALHQASLELGAQTRTLAGALRSPTVRGRWGELQLQRAVELAGMAEHCDFDTQVITADGLRPDLVVTLPGDRRIPVDAKVPLDAFLEAADCSDERRRGQLLAQHARSLRQHVDKLSAKAYWRSLEPSPEFVVLFVPGDALLDAALRADPSLTDHAFGRQVVIATPSTLIALLRTVAFTWRQERLSASAEQIHALGRELHTRLRSMTSHLDAVGRGLGRAVDSYNTAIGAMETRVLVSARRFADLGVVADRLPDLDPLTVTPRLLRHVDSGDSGSLDGIPDEGQSAQSTAEWMRLAGAYPEPPTSRPAAGSGP